jgi:uncharacterized protein (DUF1015 family)
VINDAQRESLYGSDLRNVVRVDSGVAYPDDVPGSSDQYTRAADFLASWQDLDLMQRDPKPAIYVTSHEFTHPDGGLRRRRGLLATVAAEPWEHSELRPHERTLSGPKQDRLALLRATRVQTSPVFALWTGDRGVDALLDAVTAEPALVGGRTDGEMGSEKHLLWRVDDPAPVVAIREALDDARLYVADGHHRYETAVAYAQERRTAEPGAPADAPFSQSLVYLSAAGDEALTILPTHRLVRPGPSIAFSLDDLWAQLDDAWDAEAAADIHAALATAAGLRAGHHAYAVVAPDGVAVLRRPRRPGEPARDALDPAVLEDEVLGPAGVRPEAIAAGALAYTRDPAELPAAVERGDALLGFGLQPVTPAEMIAVADAGDTMPQKSTYFYPKVPTGLVLAPV